MNLARDLLFNDTRNQLNDETREKLMQLHNSTTKSRRSIDGNARNSRLNTITELETTGKYQLYYNYILLLCQAIVCCKLHWKREWFSWKVILFFIRKTGRFKSRSWESKGRKIEDAKNV